jgi:hypothetical protein
MDMAEILHQEFIYLFGKLLAKQQQQQQHNTDSSAASIDYGGVR